MGVGGGGEGVRGEGRGGEGGDRILRSCQPQSPHVLSEGPIRVEQLSSIISVLH